MSVKKRSTGDKLRGIPTRDWNKFVDTANFVDTLRGPAANPTNGEANGTIVLVKNATRYDRNRFDVLGIDSPIITPTANLGEFKNRVMLSCSTPRTGSTTNTSIPDHTGKFVILQEPIPIGGIGKAIVAGVTIARVKVETDTLEATTAGVDDNDPEQLLAGGSGAEILWKESGKGYKWAVVRIGGAAGTTPAVEWSNHGLKENSLGSQTEIQYTTGAAYLSFADRIGSESEVGLTHDPDESAPSTQGNFAFTKAGFCRVELAWDVTANDDTYSSVTIDTVITSDSVPGHSHDVAVPLFNYANDIVPAEWRVWRKATGGAFAIVDGGTLNTPVYRSNYFGKTFTGFRSFHANFAVGDVLRHQAIILDVGPYSSMGFVIGNARFSVTRLGNTVEEDS